MYVRMYVHTYVHLQAWSILDDGRNYLHMACARADGSHYELVGVMSSDVFLTYISPCTGHVQIISPIIKKRSVTL